MQFTIDFLRTLSYAAWLATPLFSFFCVMIFILGQLVGRIEKWSMFNAFYWSFITAFTVGYGDIRPSSKPARVLAIVIALIGIMFTGVVVAITVEAAAAAFNKNTEISRLRPQTSEFGERSGSSGDAISNGTVSA